MASLIDIKGMPFDAKETIDVNGQSVYDRTYLAKHFALYFAQFIGNGVYANPASGFLCEWAGGMSISVKPGHCWVDGYHGYMEEISYLSLNPGNATNPRIDRIVIRLNLLDRKWEVAVVEGTPAAAPVAPVLNRYQDEAGNYYELGIATVYVNTGVAAVQGSNVTDTRLDSSVCGIVSGLIDQVDLTNLYTQFQSFLEENILDWNNIKANQQNAWTTQTSNQQQFWENQTNQQQEDFDERSTKQLADQEDQFNTLVAWYNTVKADISKLQDFNFDNIANLNGARKTTDFEATEIVEEIYIRTTNKKVAKRVTTTATLQVEIWVYGDTEEEFLKHSITEISFDWEGHDIVEDVSVE